MAREMASWFEVATRYANAQKSVSLLAPPREKWRLPIDQSFIETAGPSAPRRRYVLTSALRPTAREDLFLRGLHRHGWEVLWVNSPAALLGMIVDDEVAYVAASATHAFRIDDSDIVRGLSAHFEQTWTIGKSSIGVEVIYDDVLVTVGPAPAAQIQVATQAQWDRVVHALSLNVADLYRLTPRAFEELVAELLQRDHPSAHIELTPEKKDGGRDVLVYDATELGRHLFLVECKRYAPDNPIDVSLVRQFYGVVEGERATAGALVTTSYFTKPALEWLPDRKLEYRVSLKDYESLAAWLRKTSRAAS